MDRATLAVVIAFCLVVAVVALAIRNGYISEAAFWGLS